MCIKKWRNQWIPKVREKKWNNKQTENIRMKKKNVANKLRTKTNTMQPKTYNNLIHVV